MFKRGERDGGEAAFARDMERTVSVSIIQFAGKWRLLPGSVVVPRHLAGHGEGKPLSGKGRLLSVKDI